MVIIWLYACVPWMDDNSLEAVELSDVVVDDVVPVSGTLAVTAGDEEGDWTLAVGDQSWSYHSPSQVDLGALDGVEVSLTAAWSYTGSPSLTVADADGPWLVATAEDDGTSSLGRSVWRLGEVIGRGEVLHAEGRDEEAQPVHFTDVVVSTDTGDLRLLPGEPTAITLDGVPWQLTVIAAYEAENPKNAKCGAPDILSVELVRTDAPPGPRLQRAAGRYAPVGSCG